MPKRKQLLSAKKQTGNKKAEVRRLPKRSTKKCWFLIIDDSCRMDPRLQTIFLQVTMKITPDDVTLSQYQAKIRPVGVNFEEAGEKWRAGDSAKSLRFFVRAVDVYDAGLRKFPRSFDLSYNK